MAIDYLKSVDSLTDYLNRVSSIRSKWKTKKVTWSRERVTRKGEEQTPWFRGQPADAGLTPRIYRKEYKGADEAEIRQQFQSRAIQLMQSRIPDPERSWDWYFLMQHYGAPTRLLDWTDNPLIALFFAVTCERSDADAAVWILDPYWLNDELFDDVEGPLLPDWEEAQAYLKTLEKAFMSELQVRKQRSAAIDPPHVDRRLAVQGSHFVIFGKSEDMTKIRRTKNKNCRLAKVAIPSHMLVNIRGELEDAGITRSFVFPDLEALGRELGSVWKRN